MRNCIWCGKITDNPKFCSLSCGAKHQHSQPKVLKDKTKRCPQCELEFQYKVTPLQRFCSRTCSATYNNKLRGMKQCLHCGNDYQGSGKRYCSRACMGAAKNKLVVDNWIDDPTSATTEQGLAASIKRYLIEQAGNKCSLCGWGEINPVTGRSPLEVDHIDGDCYNNIPENLRVLCPNCHSLTPTYRALNKNSKRKYRTNAPIV